MSKSKKTTSTTEIPNWLKKGSKQAIGMARDIADRPYEAYEGQRFAGLDPQEQHAYAMSASGAGGYKQDLSKARTLTDRASSSFLDADIQSYMNPYIKGALEPAAREIREQGERNILDVGSKAGMTGAFGGSRQAILESEARRGSLEAVGDHYGRGYASAFESGAQMFDRDRNAAARGADQFRGLAAQEQQQLTQDIQNLLTTGGLNRRLKQAGLDFDYQQFTEARDWDITNLQPLLAALSSVPHGTTTTNKEKSSGLGNAIGVAATAAGAVMSGGFGSAIGSMAGGMFGGDGGGAGAAGGFGEEGTSAIDAYSNWASSFGSGNSGSAVTYPPIMGEESSVYSSRPNDLFDSGYFGGYYSN